MSPAGSVEASPAPAPPTIWSATLLCDNCGEETPHRILRLDRGVRTAAGRIRGVARCRVCRWTHPFDATPPARVEVALVLSDGATSQRSHVALPEHRRLEVGSDLPESTGSVRGPVRIQRIDTRDGRQVRVAAADEVATLWVVRDVGAIVPVSIVEGRRTRAARLIVPPDTRYAVGKPVRVEGALLEIVALRAHGKTWRREGDTFDARDVQRIYGRRTAMPPAGRRDWRNVRVRPSSFASSTSRSDRSRSSPGTSRTRTTPRARIALGGATVQRSSPP